MTPSEKRLTDLLNMHGNRVVATLRDEASGAKALVWSRDYDQEMLTAHLVRPGDLYHTNWHRPPMPKRRPHHAAQIINAEGEVIADIETDGGEASATALALERLPGAKLASGDADQPAGKSSRPEGEPEIVKEDRPGAAANWNSAALGRFSFESN